MIVHDNYACYIWVTLGLQPHGSQLSLYLLDREAKYNWISKQYILNYGNRNIETTTFKLPTSETVEAILFGEHFGKIFTIKNLQVRSNCLEADKLTVDTLFGANFMNELKQKTISNELKVVQQHLWPTIVSSSHTEAL